MLPSHFAKPLILALLLTITVGWAGVAGFQIIPCSGTKLGHVDDTMLAPRAAVGDLPFNAYLDQLTGSQAPSGTLAITNPPTLRGTFLAVRALQLLGYGSEVDSTAASAFVTSCYNSSSHLFVDGAVNTFEGGIRVSGYSPIEATYYALASLDLLGSFEATSWAGTVEAIATLQDATGGYACRPGLSATHDAYFAYATLSLLGRADRANAANLGTFLDGRQLADDICWWEYGGITNLPADIGQDTDFTEPNLVSAYYAAAAMSASGNLGTLNEAALVQFAGLLENQSSNLYSYALGNERAEHVGTAFFLALDPLLSGDGAIDYVNAGTALLARVEQGMFNEGRRAPANHTLSALCEVIWGLSVAGRLAELSSDARAQVRAYISSYLVTSGSLAGYSLTNGASFRELADVLPAITGASKMDQMNVNALYAYLRNLYYPTSAEFAPDGNVVLQHDLPTYYNPTSPDGFLARGVSVLLPALQALKAVGRLNDFLGATHDATNILNNLTASQYLNASDLNYHGAFGSQAAFVAECTENILIRNYISPQWTLAALQAIAILAPANPASYFDEDALWQYLSQFYVEGSETVYFAPPCFINVSAAEWTCRVIVALCKAGMASFLNIAKLNMWLLANLDLSSAREVAWHLKVLAAIPDMNRADYAVGALNVLQADLLAPGNAWYRSQDSIWPDTAIVHALLQLRGDRQMYLLHPSMPNPVTFGKSDTVAIDVSSLFSLGCIVNPSVNLAIAGKDVLLTQTTPGHYEGTLLIPFRTDLQGAQPYKFTATAGGWTSTTLAGLATFDGTLLANVTCGESRVTSGDSIILPNNTISLSVTLMMRFQTGETAAKNVVVNASIAGGNDFATNVTLREGVPGTYALSHNLLVTGAYSIAITADGEDIAKFTVIVENVLPKPTSPDTGEDPTINNSGQASGGFSGPLLGCVGALGIVTSSAGLVIRRNDACRKGWKKKSLTQPSRSLGLQTMTPK